MEVQYLLQISEITFSGNYMFVLFGFLCLPFSQKLFGSGHTFFQGKSRSLGRSLIMVSFAAYWRGSISESLSSLKQAVKVLAN